MEALQKSCLVKCFVVVTGATSVRGIGMSVSKCVNEALRFNLLITVMILMCLPTPIMVNYEARKFNMNSCLSFMRVTQTRWLI